MSIEAMNTGASYGIRLGKALSEVDDAWSALHRSTSPVVADNIVKALRRALRDAERLRYIVAVECAKPQPHLTSAAISKTKAHGSQ